MSEEFNPNVIKGKMRRSKEAWLSGGKSPAGEIQGSGPANRHGMPQVPPGQHTVPNWPVLDLGIQPDISLEKWTLQVSGEVEHPLHLDWQDFLNLPQVVDHSDFHCVTSWSRLDNKWEGVRFKTIAEKAGLKPAARFVFITGYDGYSTNLRLDECLDDDVLLVYKWNDQLLPREHGGPVRMITPRKYAWKGSKWIKEIIFLKEDRLGFWEVRGYSNTAEPWEDDRYATPEF